MVIKEKDFQAFVGGDERSFEVIFYQYYKTLVSFAMRHGLEQMRAEDIVIEVFHRIWLIREKLKSPAAIHTLLFTATRNRTLNLMRDLRNHQKIIERQFSGDEIVADDHLMEEEMSRLLDKAISCLSGQCEQVILGLLAGKSIQEVADEMNISVNTAKTYKLRAIQVLRDLLQESTFLLLLFLMEKGEDSKKIKKNQKLTPIV